MNANKLTFACQGIDVVQSVFTKDAVPKNANAGLVFDRYLKMWQKSADGMPVPDEKTEYFEILRSFATDFNNRKNGPCKDVLDAFYRRLRPIDKRLGIRRKIFRLSWRFATGLGSFHPLENGFSFDYRIGVPAISGSGIKGVCRRAAKIGLVAMSEDRIVRLFGPENIEPGIAHEGQGQLVFFDALPANWPTLRVDIVNCHHMEYYERLGKGENENQDETGREHEKKRRSPLFPKETENPNPVFFLTVDRGAEFVFRVGCREKNSSKKKEYLDEAFVLLKQGLEILGAGAKTAAGYGFFDLAE